MKFTTGSFTYKEIKKQDFAGDWPFLSDSCLVGRDPQQRYVVLLSGKAFALNGAARKDFKLTGPHDSGRAVIGKSIQPFRVIAKGLM